MTIAKNTWRKQQRI